MPDSMLFVQITTVITYIFLNADFINEKCPKLQIQRLLQDAENRKKK